jgi:hypothetical protein
MKNQEAESTLYEVASMQGGYFTAQQANDAGYSQKNHHYYVKNGMWIKEYRGIYRLARYPEPDDSQYILWSLWSRNRNGEILGTYSHETALSLFELSDTNPDKLHMTVTQGFRKTAKVPEILVLHKAAIQRDEIEQREGYNVLKPIPNLILLINEKRVSEEILIQTIRDGIERGYFIKNYLLNMDTDTEVKETLKKLLKRVR